MVLSAEAWDELFQLLAEKMTKPIWYDMHYYNFDALKVSQKLVANSNFYYIKQEDEGEEKISPSQSRLMKMCAPEWLYILVGSIAAIIMGLFTPIYGIVFGDILGVSISLLYGLNF